MGTFRMKIKSVAVSLTFLLLHACTMKVREAAAPSCPDPESPLVWPPWKPASPDQLPPSDLPFAPTFIELGRAHVATYGPRPDGSEHFVIKSRRKNDPPDGLLALHQCFLPESVFAGRSPLQVETNTLQGRDRHWFYPAFDFRSTFFDLLPALTEKPKGLIFYHTSIMLLSVAEKQLVNSFRRRGWNVVVGLPPDSLFRTLLPVRRPESGSVAAAAELVARDMDQHYLEQAHSTRVVLQYLAQSRPDWLKGPKVLMGTSAGTFGMPAEILMNPDWDALVFLSGGTNLLEVYESESTPLFKDTLKWARRFRKEMSPKILQVFTDQEYREIYRRAASLTRFHAGALASRVRHYPILIIAGTLDRIVPARQATALDQALGHPEKWTAALGHHLIAVRVILEASKIDRWLESKVFDTSGS